MPLLFTLTIRLFSEEKLSPGSLLLANNASSYIQLPECTVDLSTMPHCFSLVLTYLFPSLVPLLVESWDLIHIKTFPTYPNFLSGTPWAQNPLCYGSHPSTFWVLSINSEEFIKAEALVHYLRSLQKGKPPMLLPLIVLVALWLLILL